MVFDRCCRVEAVNLSRAMYFHRPRLNGIRRKGARHRVPWGRPVLHSVQANFLLVLFAFCPAYEVCCLQKDLILDKFVISQFLAAASLAGKHGKIWSHFTQILWGSKYGLNIRWSILYHVTEQGQQTSFVREQFRQNWRELFENAS